MGDDRTQGALASPALPPSARSTPVDRAQLLPWALLFNAVGVGAEEWILRYREPPFESVTIHGNEHLPTAWGEDNDEFAENAGDSTAHLQSIAGPRGRRVGCSLRRHLFARTKLNHHYFNWIPCSLWLGSRNVLVYSNLYVSSGFFRFRRPQKRLAGTMYGRLVQCCCYSISRGGSDCVRLVHLRANPDQTLSLN
jgi:hypothetical protein